MVLIGHWPVDRCEARFEQSDSTYLITRGVFPTPLLGLQEPIISIQGRTLRLLKGPVTRMRHKVVSRFPDFQTSRFRVRLARMRPDWHGKKPCCSETTRHRATSCMHNDTVVDVVPFPWKSHLSWRLLRRLVDLRRALQDAAIVWSMPSTHNPASLFLAIHTVSVRYLRVPKNRAIVTSGRNK